MGAYSPPLYQLSYRRNHRRLPGNTPFTRPSHTSPASRNKPHHSATSPPPYTLPYSTNTPPRTPQALPSLKARTQKHRNPFLALSADTQTTRTPPPPTARLKLLPSSHFTSDQRAHKTTPIGHLLSNLLLTSATPQTTPHSFAFCTRATDTLSSACAECNRYLQQLPPSDDNTACGRALAPPPHDHSHAGGPHRAPAHPHPLSEHPQDERQFHVTSGLLSCFNGAPLFRALLPTARQKGRALLHR